MCSWKTDKVNNYIGIKCKNYSGQSSFYILQDTYLGLYGENKR